MWRINFELGENFNENQKECVCKKKINQERARKKNAEDAAKSIIEILTLCGIPEYKANQAINFIVKALVCFDEIYYRVDRVPRKRLFKEDLIYWISFYCQFTRKETLLTTAITRRVFRALYFNTKQNGEKLDDDIETFHSQECVFVHAAKRIAQILAAIEGMFLKTQIMFEERIKCIFKPLYDKIKQRATGYELRKCECPKCLKGKKRNLTKKCKSKEKPAKSSSSEEEANQHKKFCLQVCAEKCHKMDMFDDFIEEETESEEKLKIIRKCNCPKLTCDPKHEGEFQFPSLESSQGPFICKWLPMPEEEDICDEICSATEKPRKTYVEEEYSASYEIVCDEHICEGLEDENGTYFYDNFEEGTVSINISQPSCHIFHCVSDISIEAEVLKVEEYTTEASCTDESVREEETNRRKKNDEDTRKSDGGKTVTDRPVDDTGRKQTPPTGIVDKTDDPTTKRDDKTKKTGHTTPKIDKNKKHPAKEPEIKTELPPGEIETELPPDERTKTPKDQPTKKTETPTETPVKDVIEKVDEPRKKEPSKEHETKTETPTKQKRISKDNTDISKIDKRRKVETPKHNRNKIPKDDGQIKKQPPKKPPTGKKEDSTVVKHRKSQTPERSGKSLLRVGKQIRPCCVCPEKNKKKVTKHPKCVEPDEYYPFEDDY